MRPIPAHKLKQDLAFLGKVLLFDPETGDQLCIGDVSSDELGTHIIVGTRGKPRWRHTITTTEI